mgnify:CR=1 FL=1
MIRTLVGTPDPEPEPEIPGWLSTAMTEPLTASSSTGWCLIVGPSYSSSSSSSSS